jgi:hypothetical protein
MVFPLDRQSPSGPRLPSPSGGGGAVLQIAEETSDFPNIPTIFLVPVLKDPVLPLEVSFVEWATGDVLIVEAYSQADLNTDLGELAYRLIPTIDAGAGFQIVSPVSGESVIASAGTVSGISLMSTVAVRLDAPPTVRLLLQNSLSAGLTGSVSKFLLRAYRCAGASFVQGPNGVLV